jgi:hypothetical protein
MVVVSEFSTLIPRLMLLTKLLPGLRNRYFNGLCHQSSVFIPYILQPNHISSPSPSRFHNPILKLALRFVHKVNCIKECSVLISKELIGLNVATRSWS